MANLRSIKYLIKNIVIFVDNMMNPCNKCGFLFFIYKSFVNLN